MLPRAFSCASTPRPMTALEKWMCARGLRQTDLAARLDVRRSTVSLWLSGQRTPERKFANRIAALTEGAVPATYWDKKPQGGRRGRRKAA